MKRTLILATVLTAIGISGAGLAMAANGGAGGGATMTEAQMFRAASVTLDEAGKIALREAPGALAAIGFEDEDGKGVYEAMVFDADGRAMIVMIDADSGAVLAKGLASAFDDEEDHGHRASDGDGESDDDDDDGETDDDG